MDEPLGSVAEITEMRESVDHRILVGLDDPRLAKVLRLRLIGYHRYEYPRWDISYCYGELKDGTRCRVQIPLSTLSRNWRADLVNWGRANKVFVKGLGVLDDAVVSKLYG
jgi:hypothetical protein